MIPLMTSAFGWLTSSEGVEEEYDNKTGSRKSQAKSFLISWGSTILILIFSLINDPDCLIVSNDHHLSVPTLTRPCKWARSRVSCIDAINKATGGGNRRLSDKIMDLYLFTVVGRVT